MTVRRKKTEDMLHLVLMMQRPGGVSLKEIQETFDKGRRTAERMRDALRDAMDDFSPLSTESFWDYDEQDNRVKKWRLRSSSINSISGIKPEEMIPKEIKLVEVVLQEILVDLDKIFLSYYVQI